MALLVMVLVAGFLRCAQSMASVAMGTSMPLLGMGVSALLALAQSMASSALPWKVLTSLL